MVDVNELIDSFFMNNAVSRLAVTFDEVTFQDRPSDVHPNTVNLDSNLTKKIKLRVPVISSPMDTVSEKEMCLAMAKAGGIGILHRNMTGSEQANMVKWVRNKIHFGGMVEDPIKFTTDARLSDLEREVKRNKLTFTNFPIINKDNKLVGMVSRNELEFVEDDNPALSDIMIPLDKLVKTTEINKYTAYDLMKKTKVKKLPVIDNDNNFIGLYTWNDIRSYGANDQFSLDDEGHFLVGAAVGIGETERLRVDKLMEVGCKLIVIDTSHGACVPVLEMLNYIKDKYKDLVEVIVGNIASKESAIWLMNNKYKPDGLRVGISVGSICTTRRVTAHGMPQMTAIYEVWKGLKETGNSDIPIIADGGVRYSGDCVKAFAVGASAVMMGGVLAGAAESSSKLIIQNGHKYKMVRGMGSRSAMEERTGSRNRYFGKYNKEGITIKQKDKLVPEGVEGLVNYKGTIESVITEFAGGIKAGFAHSGAKNIIEFRDKAIIWSQGQAGILEGNPHSLVKQLD